MAAQVFEGEKVDLIAYLGLQDYHRVKISIGDVMEICNESNDDKNVEGVAWKILKKLVMLDHQAYSSEIKSLERSTKKTQNESAPNMFSELEGLSDDLEQFNPQDVFLAIFNCCNLNLRQILVQKMHMCRLAFPVFSPGNDGECITFNLWGLRSTILGWRGSDGKTQECSSTNHPIHIASCIRLDRPDFSKSKLLNNIMSDLSQDTFFNLECANGKVKRVTTDGLVEGSYFLPSSKPNETMNKVTLFLNLRGDGLQLEKQIDVLTEFSHVIMVCVDISDITKTDCITQMRRIYSTKSKVVIVFSNRKGIDIHKIKQKWQNLIENLPTVDVSSTKPVFAFKRFDETRWKNDSREMLSKALNGTHGKVLESLSHRLRKKGLRIDEDDPSCQLGWKLRNATIAYLKGGKTKSQLLPLQGNHWEKWCKQFKLSKHAQDGDPNTALMKVDAINKEMIYHKNEQAKLVKNLSPFISFFVMTLEKIIDTPPVEYYLQWLNIYLDELSRQSIFPLRTKYNELKMSSKDTKSERYYKELSEIKKKLEDHSWGVEHVMREMGQIYESSIVHHGLPREKFRKLPQLVAKLILGGQPFEILDGDASGIPRSWLKAVFTELENLEPNKKVYVLSVLGIQSSGKSTLLNTMFGLKCPVSAGRCTRGVFMQLIKVAANANFTFDYIAVIDSEGLRAIELGESKVDHDNQLATFVIGLSNLTLLNIKGENVSDIKDILQIVAHAFLRMKIVNESIQNERACVFLHQNVAAVNAAEMMAEGAQKLVKALDERTKEAAALEHKMGVQHFNEVIQFNNQSDVWYLPDLWTGEPPMAFVNKGYQEKVTAIKSKIINYNSQQSQSMISFAGLELQIEDMWNGVLIDDFVFGFRNSAVTKAYTSLEDRVAELKWELQQTVSSWLNDIQWNSYGTQDDLRKNSTKLKTDVVQLINNKGADNITQLDKFMDNDSQKKIMAPWKEEKKIALRYAIQSKCIAATMQIECKDQEQNVVLQTGNHVNHKADLFKKAEELAGKLKGCEMNPAKLETEFQKMWNTWTNFRWSNASCTTEDDILKEVRHALDESFPTHRGQVDQQINDTCQMPSYQTLHGFVEVSDISENRDLSFTMSAKGRRRVQDSPAAKTDVVNTIDTILKSIERELGSYHMQRQGFQSHFPTKIFKLLIDKLSSFNTHARMKRYSLTMDFQIKFAIHVYRYLVQYCKREQKTYLKVSSPSAKLEAYKQASLSLFMNILTKKSEQHIFVDMIGDQLDELVGNQVQKQIQVSIVKEMFPHFITKRKLIKAMLENLADKECYEGFSKYIKAPLTFAKDWLYTYVNDFIFGRRESSTWYGATIKQIIQNLSQDLKKAGERACLASKHKSSDFWTKEFIKEVSQIMFLSETPLQDHGKDVIDDIGILYKILEQRIDKVMENVLLAFQKHNADNVKWTDPIPASEILKNLWGCDAVCPFCHEPCLKDTHDQRNDPHECVLHRPTGITRWHNKDSMFIGTSTCSFKVLSNDTYCCGGISRSICDDKHSEKRVHYHKDVRTHIPSWKIQPTPDMESATYWMWFMNKFQTELIAGTKFNIEIPQTWENITKKDAIASLNFWC